MGYRRIADLARKTLVRAVLSPTPHVPLLCSIFSPWSLLVGILVTLRFEQPLLLLLGASGWILIASIGRRHAEGSPVVEASEKAPVLTVASFAFITHFSQLAKWDWRFVAALSWSAYAIVASFLVIFDDFFRMGLGNWTLTAHRIARGRLATAWPSRALRT